MHRIQVACLFVTLVGAAVPQMAAAGDGAVVLIGDVAPPPGLRGLSGAQILERLGMAGSLTPAPASPDASLGHFEKGRALYFDRGRPKAAIAELRLGRDAIPARVRADARGPVFEGLLLLGRLLLEQGGTKKTRADEIAACLRRAVELDPAKALSTADYPPRLVAGFQAQVTAHRQAARTIRVRLEGAPDGCQVHVDGVARGPLFRTLGPFSAGDHAVAVRCGDHASWERKVPLADRDADVTVAAHELGLAPLAEGLRARGGAPTDGLVARLQGAAGTDWVLVVRESEEAGQIAMALHRQAGSGPARTVSTEPAAASGWVSAQLSGATPEVLPTGGAPTSRSSRWWHYVVLGTGAALVAAGGGTHAAWAAAVNETNAGKADRRSDAATLGATTYTLYGVGSAAVITGVVLAIVGMPDEPPRATVVPGPGSVSFLMRF